MSPFSLHDQRENSYSFCLNELNSSKKHIFLSILSIFNSRNPLAVVRCILLLITLFSLADSRAVEATPRGDEGKLIGSVTGDVKTGGQWVRDEGSDAPQSIQTLELIWGVTPSIDYALNHFIWVGGELGVSWLNEPTRLLPSGASSMRAYEGGQRLIFTPALRGRLDFPLDCRWIIEGGVNVGIAIWGATRGVSSEVYDERRWGISWQTQMGLRYVMNTQVHLLISGGYGEQQVYTDRGAISVSTFPINLGLRGGF